jgi:NAD(P)-dependent dehydrogenase (short-subunit alcohol dehydrogenase family)
VAAALSGFRTPGRQGGAGDGRGQRHRAGGRRAVRREGADVAILYLNEHDDAAETKRIVESEGRRALTIAGDVGDKQFCQAAVDEVVEAFGKLDVLVNNAGEQHPDQEITDITEEQLRRTFQTNIFGMFFMTQAARPHLKEGAAIVNCTSVTSYKGSEELLDYSSTKGAITAFTRALSGNLAEKGIRVNGVAPGPIWTPLNPMGGASPEKLESFGEDTPMGRPGQPNEVAPAFLFLACEDSSYMTGKCCIRTAESSSTGRRAARPSTARKSLSSQSS